MKPEVIYYSASFEAPPSLPRKLESYGSASLSALVNIGILATAARVLQQTLVRIAGGVESPSCKEKQKLLRAINAATKLLVNANTEYENAKGVVSK